MLGELLHFELFGHKRGAFTCAINDRLGLFPAADGRTVFLDEIADVSLIFQVGLLRSLQEGEVKPLGSALYIFTGPKGIVLMHNRTDGNGTWLQKPSCILSGYVIIS